MNTPTAILIVCVVLSTCVTRGITYSTGAPPEGCWSDRPLHGDNLPQGGFVLPYRIEVSATAYSPEDTITVSIKPADDTNPITHKGFLLKMVSSSSQRGGLWAVDRKVHRYKPECGVTHKDPRVRTNTTILWRAPPRNKGHLGNIQFRAVVVSNFTHFWDGVVSDTITPSYPQRGDTGMMRRFQQIFSILSDNTSQKPGTAGNDVKKGNNSAIMA